MSREQALLYVGTDGDRFQVSLLGQEVLDVGIQDLVERGFLALGRLLRGHRSAPVLPLRHDRVRPLQHRSWARNRRP